MDITKKYKLSIHQFIEKVSQEGDLLVGFFSQRRAVEGTRGHSKVQKNRGEKYKKEISIVKEYNQDDFSLLLEGRIDGYYIDGKNNVLEEIKTVEGSFPSDWENCPVLHRAQIMCYGAMWDRDNIEGLTLRITYFNIHSNQELSFYKYYSNQKLDDFLNVQLNRFFYERMELQQWSNKRDMSAFSLDFPFGEFRSGQRAFSVNMYRALVEGKILFAQAATGIGKTMGSLFPAVKAIGEGKIQRILYLTAKTTGRKMAEDTLETMVEMGLKITSITLTAKEKICLSPNSARCHGNDCTYAQGYFDKLRDLKDRIREKCIWKGEDFINIANEVGICPFELSLEWGLRADILIGDFNHMFDPIVSLKRYFLQPDPLAVLIDEAHNLPDRARDMYSVHLSKNFILSCRRAVGDSYSGLKKALNRINKKMLEFRKMAEQEKDLILMDPELDSSFVGSVRNLLQSLDEALRSKPEDSLRKTLLELFFQLRFFLQILELKKDESHSSWVIVDKKQCRIHLYCKDPAPFTTASLNKCHSSVLFSATMDPIEYFENVLCENEKMESISVPSPFPKENLKVICRTDIDTRYKQRRKGLGVLIESIHILRDNYHGHQMVFFPSFAYLNEAAELWKMTYSGDIHLQRPSMNQQEREDMIALFDNDEEQLVFAVIGGILSEGLDLHGDKLSALSIVSIGLPGICLERNLIKEHYDKKNHQGFNYAFRYPGWNRVLQAAGRLIRNETDRGIIQLLGGRFNTPFYKKLYPEHWGTVTLIDNEDDQVQEIKHFYNKTNV